MCSKKCAKPDLPGSTSLREPVSTGICSETMFGKPVGTTMTTSPFGSVFVVALNGRMSEAGSAADPMAGKTARSRVRNAPRKRLLRMTTLFPVSGTIR